MPLGAYVPVLFPTYFNLCLTAAHITLNCALCSSTRKSLSVIFGVWMCPWGVVCFRQAYSFYFCPSSPTVFERKPQLSCSAGASLCPYEHFLHVVQKIHALWQYHWLVSRLACFSDSKCVLQIALAGNQHSLPSRLSRCALKHKSTAK